MPSPLRTYKPKKPIYNEIKNVHELCRLCLKHVDEDGVTIFKDGQDVYAAVAMRIMVCVGLEMVHEESLPNKICKTCWDELEKYYKFRRKCQVSSKALKYHVLALKLKRDVKMKVKDENVSISDTVADCGSKNERQDIKKEEKLVLQTNAEAPEVIENATEKALEIEEVHIPVQSSENPDISTFLSSILLELGIISQEHGLLQHRSLAFELETGDEELEMELVEEDDTLNILEEQSSQGIADPEDMTSDTKLNPVTTRRGKTVGGRPWCSVCARSFSSRSALARHARGHAPARPHACARCGAAFKQKAVLHRHMLVHLETRPHGCSQCHKSFTQRGALRAHARAHAAPAARPLALHRCAACDKVFLYASGLSRHMLTHSGRVFACAGCHKHFRDKSSLMRHVKTVCHKGRADSINTTTGDETEQAVQDCED